MKINDPTTAFQSFKASVVPKIGDIADYDFVLSMKDAAHEGFLGVIGRDLLVRGSAVLADGVDVDFEADLTRFNL